MGNGAAFFFLSYSEQFSGAKAERVIKSHQRSDISTRQGRVASS